MQALEELFNKIVTQVDIFIQQKVGIIAPIPKGDKDITTQGRAEHVSLSLKRCLKKQHLLVTASRPRRVMHWTHRKEQHSLSVPALAHHS